MTRVIAVLARHGRGGVVVDGHGAHRRSRREAPKRPAEGTSASPRGRTRILPRGDSRPRARARYPQVEMAPLRARDAAVALVALALTLLLLGLGRTAEPPHLDALGVVLAAAREPAAASRAGAGRSPSSR